MLIDEDDLGEFINGFDNMIDGIKQSIGNTMKYLTVNEVFNKQGPSTINTSDLESRGQTPQWEPLSAITVQLKGSSAILMDTRQMINFVKWQIEDSEFDGLPDVVKFGWFEDSGDRAYIAAIHEFGLTGITQRTFDGHVMGGAPIGRTDEAKAKVRWWFRENVGINVTGRIIIPERPMLRKTADLIVPLLEDIGLAGVYKFLRKIKENNVTLNI
jgi:hypothetical protein